MGNLLDRGSMSTDFIRGARSAFVVTCASGSEGAARQELRRALPGAQAENLLLKGNLLLRADVDEPEAVAKLAQAGTQCISRVVPVQARVRIPPESEEAADIIARAAGALGRLRPSEVFLVRCERRGTHAFHSQELERAVAKLLEEMTGARGDYDVEPEKLVSIEVFQDWAFIGVNPPAHVLRKEITKARKYAPGERPLNRAQWKLREALEAFGIEVRPGERALDLGAAPGGWSLALAERGAHVVAVDPADLDSQAAGHPEVTHLRCRAEEMAGRDDLGPFDLIVDDMNVDPAHSARSMCALARLVKPGGWGIMTIKYMTAARRRHEREAVQILSQEYEEIRLRHLPHNRMETTAAMRRRGEEGKEAGGRKQEAGGREGNDAPRAEEAECQSAARWFDAPSWGTGRRSIWERPMPSSSPVRRGWSWRRSATRMRPGWSRRATTFPGSARTPRCRGCWTSRSSTWR